MIIPFKELEAQTLSNLLQTVVLREGTDYGEVELSMEEKVQSLYSKLQSGEAVLVYSQEYETVSVQSSELFR